MPAALLAGHVLAAVVFVESVPRTRSWRSRCPSPVWRPALRWASWPPQRRIFRVLGRPPVAAVAVGRSVRRLAALTGMFDVLWVVVVVLMILRPGSTTGVCR